MSTYLIHNGTLMETAAFSIAVTNRAFNYGDALFETIKVANGQICFLDDHLERLLQGMHLLRLEYEPSLTIENLEFDIQSLLQKNNLQNARIRLQLYRNEGGYYAPTTFQASYIITAEPLADAEYTLNEKGLSIDFYKETAIPISKYSNIKTANSLPYIMAGIYKKEKSLDDIILINTNGNLLEASSANLFIIKDNTFYTPALSEGPIAGVMRKQVMNILKEHNYKITEAIIKPRALLKADEIFLTNVTSGIRWVGAYGPRRFYKTRAKWLVDTLNENLGLGNQ